MTDKKVIRLDTAQKGPVEIRRKNFHECKYFPVIVDERLRTVECSRCGKLLDPVQVLLEMAIEYRQTDYQTPRRRPPGSAGGGMRLSFRLTTVLTRVQW